jgi:broad specificity phosphatase PhoE
MDTELNEVGLIQAVKNAEILKNVGNIQHIYSSPLKRAYKTAEATANLLNIGIDIVDDLKEVNGGIMEGKTWDEVKTMLSEDIINAFFFLRDEGMDLRLPGGESKREVRNRIYNAILNICKTTKYETIAISSHGTVLREFIRAVGYENDNKLGNCEIIEATFEYNEIKINRRIRQDD